MTRNLQQKRRKQKIEDYKATNKVEETKPGNVTKGVVKEDNQPAAASDVTKEPAIERKSARIKRRDNGPPSTSNCIREREKAEEG